MRATVSSQIIHQVLLFFCLLVAIPSADAEDSVADWTRRILDPTTLGVAPFPGATLNRKLTVDTIRYDRDAPSSKRTAIYILPLAQMNDAVAHFEHGLAMKPAADTDLKGAKRYAFVVTGDGGQPAKAKGLRVTIIRSPWVDGMAQIDMVYAP